MRQETLETDSFKCTSFLNSEILTKRSTNTLNKQNVISCNSKKLRKIKQEPSTNKSGGKVKPKARKSLDAKHPTAPLERLLKKTEANLRKKSKEKKSLSPCRELKDYRSGPSDKRLGGVSLTQYASVNTQAKTSRQGIAYSRS